MLPAEQKPPSGWSVLKQLLPYLMSYRGRVLVGVMALLVAAAITLSMPVAFRYLIDGAFGGKLNGASANGLSSPDVTFSFTLLFGLAILLAVSTALRYYCVSWLGDRITADLRGDVYAKVLVQSPGFFESLKTGEVLSRLSADTTLIQSLIGSSISMGLRNTLLFFGALIMMLYTSVKLAMVIIGLLLIVVIPILVFGRRVRHLSKHSQDQLADTGALAGETLNAMNIVQAYVREAHETARYRRANDVAFIAAIKRNRSRAILTAMAIILIFGAIVFTLWLGAQAVIEGTLSAGLLAQFMLYAAIAGASSGAIAEVYGDVQRAAGATTRLLELRNASPAIDASTSIRAIDPCTSGSKVEFSNVSFSYPSRPNEEALASINFIAEPGQTVALVGPSGAGKTTVLQLLLRFYDPKAGRITLDNHELPTLQLDSLRESIALVSQDSVVFSANAMENIRYGNLDATDEDVISAAKAAQAHDFISQLPEGYDTYIGERGMRLSGGQRQRLSIARAFLKNPPLLLLDEATSSLDAESEHKVQLALEEIMRARTTIVIAHRLATIKNADTIFVLDKGNIVQSGTHESLSKAQGLYAKLARMQFFDIEET